MKDTNINLRNQVMYQVFTRQHSKSQNFDGIIADLDRIKALGVDYIYLLPFHPIGKLDRKGSVGSPYSIINYYEIDPLHGTLDDFIRLVNEIHQRGMKIMIDIVFNHTSRDSDLVKEKRHLFYQKADGSLTNRIGDWSDITDLNFDKREVWDILIDVLLYWAKYVDGFRCDVAPLIPLDFWQEARLEVDKVNPNILWLTESVEYGFIKYLRDIGYDASSDSMMYQVFDICYDYDIFSYMNKYLNHQLPLSRWLEEIYRQEVIYPKNYVKLRSFENHDQERIASKVTSNKQLVHLTAMQFFLKGMPMIYAGQEYQAIKRPDLFETDLIDFNKEKSIEGLISSLSNIKKDPLLSNGAFVMFDYNDAIMMYHNDKEAIIGIFNLDDKANLKVILQDGIYTNLINNDKIKVNNQVVNNLTKPIIIKVKQDKLVKNYNLVQI